MSDTTQCNATVEAYLASLGDQQTVQDCRSLMDMMRRISGHEPAMWNDHTISFDTYRFRYDSGREGDSHAIAFYPRKGKITIYLMDGTARHAESLARLGPHGTSRVCLTIKRLSDVHLPVLEGIIRSSYEYLKAHDGQMHRALA